MRAGMKMAVLVLLAAGVCACQRPASHLAPADEVVQARVGSEFTVALNANPTTGYQWKLVPLATEASVQFVSRSFVADTPQRLGSGGTETWTFRALRAGAAQLEFTYVRPWEAGVDPVQHRTINVEILP